MLQAINYDEDSEEEMVEESEDEEEKEARARRRTTLELTTLEPDIEPDRVSSGPFNNLCNTCITCFIVSIW